LGKLLRKDIISIKTNLKKINKERSLVSLRDNNNAFVFISNFQSVLVKYGQEFRNATL
jgi:hypothetical protein